MGKKKGATHPPLLQYTLAISNLSNYAPTLKMALCVWTAQAISGLVADTHVEETIASQKPAKLVVVKTDLIKIT